MLNLKKELKFSVKNLYRAIFERSEAGMNILKHKVGQNPSDERH